MSKKFNIHDWQAKQRLSEENNPVVAKGDGLEITQDEMEKLHKNGRVKLKNGSVLVYMKEETVNEALNPEVSRVVNRFIKGIRDGKNINFIDIRDVLVPVPLEFNDKVHQTHLNILKSFSIEEKRIELLKEYRQSLISEVVTGKLKVTTDD